MPLKTPRDLFIHELSDIMSAEHIILNMLPEMTKEVQNSEAKRAFEEHERETRQQIRNLEQVFQQLGTQPQKVTCHAMEGIKKEHESLHKEQPSREVLELGTLGGSAKAEHYEIASYSSLVEMARQLGERQAETLLLQNLHQEMAMSKRVEVASEQVGKQVIGKSQSATTTERVVTTEMPIEADRDLIIES